jgi:hypothetical protein
MGPLFKVYPPEPLPLSNYFPAWRTHCTISDPSSATTELREEMESPVQEEQEEGNQSDLRRA